MWLLAFAIYFACKLLTWVVAKREAIPRWHSWAYLFAWPGMDAQSFLRCPHTNTVLYPSRQEWLFAAGNLLLGLGLLRGVATKVATSSVMLEGWIGMVGLVLALHFGAFHLLSCAWRSLGFDARPLMNRPLASVNLSEFWGRRWNTAFRDLTHPFLFRPLSRFYGPKTSIVVGFLFSGLVHDLVISVPAGGGYGGPTLFFVIQGFALLFQRSQWSKGRGWNAGWRGRLYTMAALILPANALFHYTFVSEIIVPFLRTMN